MQAIVLAGSKANQALLDRGVTHVFMLRRGGQTLMERMCRALVEGGRCDRILVRAPESIELPAIPEVSRLVPKGHVIEDVLEACALQLDSDRIFMGAADVPMINPAAVDALKDYSETVGADFVYPVVSQHEMEKQYPGTKRTYLPFSGEKFTGGNLMVFNRKWALDRQELIRFMFENRKKPLALVNRIGVIFLLRVALGLASLDYAEACVGRLAGGKVVAARLPFPEIALDLDKVEDLDFFLPYLDGPTDQA